MKINTVQSYILYDLVDDEGKGFDTHYTAEFIDLDKKTVEEIREEFSSIRVPPQLLAIHAALREGVKDHESAIAYLKLMKERVLEEIRECLPAEFPTLSDDLNLTIENTDKFIKEWEMNYVSLKMLKNELERLDELLQCSFEDLKGDLQDNLKLYDATRNPEQVTALDLGGNNLHRFDLASLGEIYSAIPPDVMFVDLSANTREVIRNGGGIHYPPVPVCESTIKTFMAALKALPKTVICVDLSYNFIQDITPYLDDIPQHIKYVILSSSQSVNVHEARQQKEIAVTDSLSPLVQTSLFSPAVASSSQTLIFDTPTASTH